MKKEDEFKLSVGVIRVNYDWEVNTCPVMEVKFEIINLNPRIDPREATDHLCKAFKEYLEQKNIKSSPN